jgi:signal transduction histidine kinase
LGASEQRLRALTEPAVAAGLVSTGDTTGRTHAEAALQHRLEFENLIATLSTKFINLSPADVDGDIQEALAAIGTFEGADRCYIVLASADGSALEVCYEWCAEGIESIPEALRRYPIGALRWLRGPARRDGVVHIPCVANLGGEAETVRQVLQRHGNRSLLSVSMTSGGTLRGALGFTTVRAEKTWGEDSITLLKIVAQMFIGAIDRKHAEQKLAASRAQLAEEAAVTAALARMGTELMGAMGTPAFPDRLCQLTASVLDCDASYTLLWRPEDGAYVPVAGHGGSREQREVARVLRVPRATIPTLLAELAHADVAPGGSTAPDLFTGALQRRFGATASLCIALRRGAEIVGLQVALCRNRREPFSPSQRRIAAGIAQIASMALEHARILEELARANRLKSEFVGTMSHELRTPLNAIIGYTDLLLEGAFGRLSAEQRGVQRRIYTHAMALLDLISATLDLNRLEAGRIALDVKPTSLAELAREIDAEIGVRRQRPDLAFRWQLTPDLPPIRTDPAKLKIVLKNLIVNAIKFTEAGKVSVCAEAVSRGMLVSVSDTGIGIAPQALDSIFEPFRQADGSSTRRHGGVGLGLYIVKRLLDVLGGSVSVESAVGRGSTFRVWIPPAPEARSARGPRRSRQAKGLITRSG